jgi:hypothetical protein
MRMTFPLVTLVALATACSSESTGKANPGTSNPVLYTGAVRSPVVDEQFVYFGVDEQTPGMAAGLTHYAIKRVPKSGGDVTDLATVSHSLVGPVIHDSHIYVAVEWTIHEIPKTGGNPTEFARAARGEINDIKVDNSGIYFRDRGGLHVVSSSGSERKTLVATEIGDDWYVTDFVLAPDTIYVGLMRLGSDGEYTIKRVAKSGGLPATVATLTERSAMYLTLHADNLYWSNMKSLRRLSVTGGEPVTIYDGSSGPRVDLQAIDGPDLFFTIEGQGLYRMPLAGGKPSLLSKASAIAIVDSSGIYSIDRVAPEKVQLIRHAR